MFLTETILKVVLYATLVTSSSAFAFNKLSSDESSQATRDEDLSEPAIWAVLVAGSNTYENYRHQADVCHAYQVLRQHGVPAENIITMMYDDIATDPKNPNQGQIFNEVGGPDVYAGVVKDYTGRDVTPQNFLNVISGNATGMQGIGSGKVLTSGSGDNVFIYFAGHVGDGILGFLESVLSAKNLQDTLLTMNQKQLYGKLVLYIEACFSGSMFNGLLPDNLNIFVMTASNSTEGSWSCCWDGDRQAHLGDAFSALWLHDSDIKDLNSVSLFDQFFMVRDRNNYSHVQEFGDLKMGVMNIGEFHGRVPKTSGSLVSTGPLLMDVVPSSEVPLLVLQHQLEACKTESEAEEIQGKIDDLKKKRQYLEDTMAEIVKESTNDHETFKQSIHSQRMKLTDHDSYEEVLRAFSDNCFNVAKNSYVSQHLYLLVNLCHNEATKENVLQAIQTVCKTPRLHTGIV